MSTFEETKTSNMKKLFIPLIAFGLLTACETTPATTEENTEVETMVDDHDGHDHDGHDHGDEMSGPEMPAVPADSKIFFANLEDGATVTSPVYVEFGAEGIEVEPAGLVKEGYGHHHIIINGDVIPISKAVPADDTHIHYGGGQKGDTLDLPAGNHTLILQYADGLHRSYGEALSAKINVTVE
jgi:hypothetical protein